MEIDTYLKGIIRDIPDFPKKGIIFKDITTILLDPTAFRKVVDAFVSRYKEMRIDAIACVESRGFVFGAPLAYLLGTKYVLARKKGKLPYKTVEVSYDLEYGSETLEMHEDAIRKGDRVLVMDDLLATGGTATATCKLCEKLGGNVVEAAFVIELEYLGGRKRLPCNAYSLVKYS